MWPRRRSSETLPAAGAGAVAGVESAEPVRDDAWDSCGTRTPRGTSAGDSPAVSACQIASGVTGAMSRLATAAPACWISAAEPRSHLPRQGERCQVTPVPFSADSVPSSTEPAGHLGAQFLRAGDLAGDVVADVHHGAWRLAGAEQGVEGRDAVRLGRRDRQPLRHVVERTRTDPARPFLDCVQHGDQQVAAVAGGTAAERDVRVLRPALAALPLGGRRPEYLVDGRALGVRRCRLRRQAQVH